MTRTALLVAVAANERNDCLRRCVVGAGFVVVAIAVLFHAAMELLFCLPPNPVGESARPLVLSYIRPYFEQYWNVFAPAPIESDIFVVARTRYVNGSATRWTNLSSALIEQVRHNTLSQYSTLKIVGMKLAESVSDDRRLFRSNFRPAEAASFVDPQRRPIEIEGLGKLALFLNGAPPAGAIGTELGIVEHRYPRFTHRNENNDSNRNNVVVRFPILPFAAANAEAIR